MRILRWLGVAVVALVAIGAVAYATRSDPVGPIAGRQVTGEIVSTPVSDWTFTDEHMTIALETRPAKPHSVTTVCFTHEGALYVPAQQGASKSWTHYAVSDPRVRLKIGDKVYPARATRVTDSSLAPALRAAASEKYDFDAGDDDPDLEDIWVFRLDPSPSDVAGAPPESSR
ncbi:MAG: hypothetical protein V3T14_10330 [Myxococcota bacterium]